MRGNSSPRFAPTALRSICLIAGLSGCAELPTETSSPVGVYTLRLLDGAPSPFRRVPVIGDTTVVVVEVLHLKENGVAERRYIKQQEVDRGLTWLQRGSYDVSGSTITVNGVDRLPMTGVISGRKMTLREGSQEYVYDRPN
jgi:hypothetical protein